MATNSVRWVCLMLTILCGVLLACSEPELPPAGCNPPAKFVPAPDIFTDQFDTRFAPQVEWRQGPGMVGNDSEKFNHKLLIEIIDFADINNDNIKDIAMTIHSRGFGASVEESVSYSGLVVFWNSGSGPQAPSAIVHPFPFPSGLESYGDMIGHGGDDLLLYGLRRSLIYEENGELHADDVLVQDKDFIRELETGHFLVDVNHDGFKDIQRYNTSSPSIEVTKTDIYFGPFSTESNWDTPSISIEPSSFSDLSLLRDYFSDLYTNSDDIYGYDEPTTEFNVAAWVVPMVDGALLARVGVGWSYTEISEVKEYDDRDPNDLGGGVVDYFYIPAPVAQDYIIPSKLDKHTRGLSKFLGFNNPIADLSGDGLPDLLWFEEDKLQLQWTLPRAGGWWDPVVEAEICAERVDTGAMNVSVGDFNGDGFNDLLVGTPDWTPTPDEAGYGKVIGNPLASGAVYLVLGPITKTVSLSHAAVKIEGSPGERLGSVVALGADINGDGMNDAFVGATGHDASQRGDRAQPAVDGYLGVLMGRDDL